MNKWETAQQHELRWHRTSIEDFDTFYFNYFDGYRQLFSFVGLSFDLGKKSIIEIGAGPYPALAYCVNHEFSMIIDTIVYPTYRKLLHNRTDLNFDTDYSRSGSPYDEAWLFNCLQHVEDPVSIINWCKKNTGTVRYFEPIDLPTDIMHLHTFSADFFTSHFGIANIYVAKENVQHFHEAKCAYGVWNKV